MYRTGIGNLKTHSKSISYRVPSSVSIMLLSTSSIFAGHTASHSPGSIFPNIFLNSSEFLKVDTYSGLYCCTLSAISLIFLIISSGSPSE